MYYIALDGDDAGKIVEQVLLDNDPNEARALSDIIKGAFTEIRRMVVSHRGNIVFEGGDNVLFTVGTNAETLAEEARAIYKNSTGHTATAGVGKEPLDAHKGLVVGKNLGKDQVVVWSPEQEGVYAQIKAKQQEMVQCEEAFAGEGLHPGLKYRAGTHYQRLLGAGFDEEKASQMIFEMYGSSFRDVLRARHRQNLLASPDMQYLREGEQKYADFVESLALESQNRPMFTQPGNFTVGQKFVTKDDLGMIHNIGARFVAIEWVKNGKRERVALSKFRKGIKNSEITLLPSIRVALTE